MAAVIFYFIPFFIHLFGESETLSKIMLSIALFGWMIMYAQELIYVYASGVKDFFSDFFNCINLIGLAFPVYFGMVITNPKNSLVNDNHANLYSEGKIETSHKQKVIVILNMLLIFDMVLKFVFYLRISDTYGL